MFIPLYISLSISESDLCVTRRRVVSLVDKKESKNPYAIHEHAL